jgi:transposase InsO family protein
MIDRTHPLPVRQQCHLLNLARSTVYYEPTSVSATTLALMRRDLLRQEEHTIGRGFVYLFAVLDWASRRVPTWWLSNALTTDFYLEAVREAITQYGCPEIFNTDQGCSSRARSSRGS